MYLDTSPIPPRDIVTVVLERSFCLQNGCVAWKLTARKNDGETFGMWLERHHRLIRPEWVAMEFMDLAGRSVTDPIVLAGIKKGLERMNFMDPCVQTHRIAILGDPIENSSDFYQEVVPCGIEERRARRTEECLNRGMKLGEINRILEIEGFPEVSGAGVMPCPTKHHEIVRDNKGARRMIQKDELALNSNH